MTQFFSQGGTDPNSRAILVKVIVTTDPEVRDAIIRATNNQTAVETASLRATDSKQRDIEDILERHGLFYERRKNYHLNLGRAHEAIVSPLYAAAAVVTLILKSPSVATRLKQRFMRDAASYDAVFGGDLPLDVWPKAVMVLRATDAFLKGGGVAQKRPGERFLRNWRQVTALLAVGRATDTFAFGGPQLARFDVGLLSEDLFREVWQVIDGHRHRTSTNPPIKQLVRRVAEEASARFGIQAHQAVEARHPFAVAYRTRIDDEFMNAVDAALPDQPWKPGVHREVAARLNCSARQVSEAIEALMVAGRRHAQKDGVVFSEDGAVIAFDAERVSADEAREARLER